MIHRLRVDTVFRATIAAMMVMTATHAPAQDEAADRVPSVASRIPRAAADGAGPVAVIDRRDIELSGMKNLRHLLERGLAYNNFGLYRPFVLGTGRVAILVNGRRISDSTLIDFEILPVSAVERVEILSDSAAALHGGHAIAGAINIVLRRGFEGVEVQASAARPNQEGGDSEHGSFVWGGALGRGHIVIGADIVGREEIRDADRDYSRGKWTPGGSFEDARNISTGGNTLFITLPPPPAERTISRPLGACEGSAYIRGLTDPRDHPGVGCGFDYSATKWHDDWERLGREGLFLSAEHPLGEGAKVYLDARVAQSESRLLYAPSVGTFSFTPSQPLKDKLLQDPEIDALPDQLLLAHRFVGHGNREWVTDTEEYDLSLGVQGRLGGVGYDAHVRYYLHDAAVNGDTFVSASAIAKVVEDGRYDVENPFSTDPDHRAAVRETSLRLKQDRVTEHKAARASFNGAAFPLSGGNIRWAAGAEVASQEWRNVRVYRDTNGRSYEPIDVLGSGGSSSVGERRRWAAFAEVSLPLLKDWDLTFAGRRDDHDDVGATFSHQIASRYRLNRNLALRASWSKGAKAPGLDVLNLRQLISYPYVCDVKTHTGHIRDCNRIQVERVSGGNPNLKPDDAESLNIGAAATLGPFSLSLDWFQLNLSDAPAELNVQSILDLEAKGQLPSGVRVIRVGDVIRRIEGSYTNTGETDVEGLDLRARLDWETEAADVVFDLRWSRVTEHESRVAGEKVPVDHPRDRVHGSLRVRRDRLTANWSTYAVSDYWNTLRTARYERWIGHDFTLRWRKAFGLRGLELIGGVFNITDQGPSTASGSPDLTLASALGRTPFLNAKFSFRL